MGDGEQVDERRLKGRGMKGVHKGKGEVGEGKGEEICAGAGRRESQGPSHALFAKKDKEGWSVHAEDVHV